MTIYDRFNRLDIDTMPLGIIQEDNENLFFCTPKGAKIIGWAGVDGIHFCFIRGFGEIVFSVSPMNTSGNYVHPLAGTFSDFLCLLLACGSTAALEPVHGWNQSVFDTFLAENPITDEQMQMLRIISERLRLEPMKQPFTYMKQLQAEFDLNRVEFTEGYEDFVPPESTHSEWNVFFDGNFWGYSKSQIAGGEIPVNMQFVLNDGICRIPSVYTCSQGLVIDFCVQVPIGHIRDFISKWNLSVENDGSDLTKEQQMQIEAENPMAIHIRPEIILNERTFSCSHGCGLSFNPCYPERNSSESEGVLKHYGFDPGSGWVIWRFAFPGPETHHLEISSLSVIIKHDPIEIPGCHFCMTTPGECIDFIHPITNLQHTLTLEEYEQQEMPADQFGDRNYEYPTYYTVMNCTVCPELLLTSLSG